MLDLRPDPYTVTKCSGQITTNVGYNVAFNNIDINRVNRFLVGLRGNLKQFADYMAKELSKDLGNLELRRAIEHNFRRFINYRYETYGPGWRGWSNDYLQFMIQHGRSQRLLYRTGAMKDALDEIRIEVFRKNDKIISLYPTKKTVSRLGKDYTFYHQQFGRGPYYLQTFYRRPCFKRQAFRREFMRIVTFYTRARFIQLPARKILPETKEEIQIVYRKPIVEYFMRRENRLKMKKWFAEAMKAYFIRTGGI